MPGYNLVSNPLNSANNTVTGLFASAEDGTQIYRFNEITQSYILNSKDFGVWSNPNMSFVPGEGFFVNALSARTINFVGEALEGELVNFVDASTTLALRGSVAALSGLLQTTLGFPPFEGLQINLWIPGSQTYSVHTYALGAWDTQPSIPIATSFWIRDADTRFPINWRQSFWVPRRP